MNSSGRPKMKVAVDTGCGDAVERGEDDLLVVKDLEVNFNVKGRRLHAVRGVNFRARGGETVAIVGESGSGKSATVQAVARLTARMGGEVTGQVVVSGTSILKLADKQIRPLRGKEISLVFQDSGRSLDPSQRIGKQVIEAYKVHNRVSRQVAEKKAIDALARVKLPNPELQMRRYPDQLSGGMRQRVCIAMAIICQPKILIADEATTALDVTTEAEILDMLLDIAQRSRMLLLMVTHDLSIAALHADRILVMYAGKIVEEGTADEIFHNPKMPYTRALLECNPEYAMERGERLHSLPGQPPSPLEERSGCPFAPRCGRVQERCQSEEPTLLSAGDGHKVACWYPV